MLEFVRNRKIHRKVTMSTTIQSGLAHTIPSVPASNIARIVRSVIECSKKLQSVQKLPS